eukprot:NODE_5524_length_403_cov_134.556497_g4834_i0.p1 GENE.NODE_5524_length_403_cov_134.556497_g4834_i0~~NODE_5524_length_403_cov_134.556497_g4834_i0.p1  ORF type:complete len:93 (-),score=44.75 NODE_5524_length_403_cov_134.556497_g4834_i0:125-364(-)
MHCTHTFLKLVSHIHHAYHRNNDSGRTLARGMYFDERTIRTHALTRAGVCVSVCMCLCVCVCWMGVGCVGQCVCVGVRE